MERPICNLRDVTYVQLSWQYVLLGKSLQVYNNTLKKYLHIHIFFINIVYKSLKISIKLWEKNVYNYKILSSHFVFPPPREVPLSSLTAITKFPVIPLNGVFFSSMAYLGLAFCGLKIPLTFSKPYRKTYQIMCLVSPLFEIDQNLFGDNILTRSPRQA